MTISFNDIIYNSGDVFLPKSIRDLLVKGMYFDNKTMFYLNGWTLIHVLSGIISGFIYIYLNKPLKYYYYKMFVIHTLWELWQMLIGMSHPYKLTGNSNLIDIIIDTLAFMLGSYLTLTFYKNNYL